MSWQKLHLRPPLSTVVTPLTVPFLKVAPALTAASMSAWVSSLGVTWAVLVSIISTLDSFPSNHEAYL